MPCCSHSSNGKALAFLITIDTEGDNLWSRPRNIKTRNAEYLPRFQELCEKYTLKPTYLTNWEMATCRCFKEFGRDVVRRNVGEIGMHLHAWNSPPLTPLTGDDFTHMPYLTEYPELTIREKVGTITERLQETFSVKMYSHRSGRWAFDETYARILADTGYVVDCSVTPHISRRMQLGSPNGRGGTDYTSFPESAYFMDSRDISQSGDSGLLEIPVTIIKHGFRGLAGAFRRGLRMLPKGNRLARRFFPDVSWLRPNGHNRRSLLRIVSVAREQCRDYVEFMLHSSEFMPGGSPSFPTAGSIESLYDDLEALFDAVQADFVGLTLKEYYDRFKLNRRSIAGTTAQGLLCGPMALGVEHGLRAGQREIPSTSPAPGKAEIGAT